MYILVRAVQATGMTLSWFQRYRWKPTFRRRANLSSLSKVCNHFTDFREIAAWNRKSLSMIEQYWRFLEKDPLQAYFHKNYSERIHHVSEPRIVCKFREIWPTGSRWNRALLISQKNKKSSRSLVLASKRIAPKICQGQFRAIYSRVPQISSKSVQFRRSYSRTRERRWNAPQSVSNTRRSYSFFAE